MRGVQNENCDGTNCFRKTKFTLPFCNHTLDIGKVQAIEIITKLKVNQKV